MTIIFLTYAVLITNLYQYKSKYNINEKNIVGTITKYNIDGNKITIHIKAKETIIANYYIPTEKELIKYKNNLKLGDTLKLTGTLKEISKNTTPNIFNYKKYLYYNKIYYLMDIDKIEKISSSTNILYYIKNKIIERIENIDNTGYLKIFILGDKSLVDDITMINYQNNGISHLFSISGMHISLIATIIIFFLKKVSYNIRLNYLIVIIFLLFYLFLTNISSSILRTTIMYILMAINKSYNLKIKAINIILLVLIIAIIINPFYIYNIGFQFSYMISFTLILISPKIKKIQNKLIKNLYISSICFLTSFPICIYNFFQVNFLSIFLNIILIPIVGIIIYPLSLLVFIFPFLENIFVASINILEAINNLFASIDIFKVVFSKTNLLIIIVYYLTIYLSIFNKKYIILFLLIIIFHKISIYIDSSLKVIALDVGQGDSIFIKLPNNKGNVLIDTGGVITYNKEKWSERSNTYSIATSKIIPYLKSIGINKLDYLILTHGDFDHMGEAINLVNNFKVEKVIFNCGNFNELEQELIKVLDKKQIPYYSCINELNIDDNKLYFLNNELYGNENDNSSVIYTKLNNHKFLFMGDAGVEVEEDLIKKYNLQDIDVLKVGHHGSKTSSSKNFIDNINPKYSIISVGENNRYGHPNKEVLENLEKSKIYRTDMQGSIMFKIKNNKLKIETCSP